MALLKFFALVICLVGYGVDVLASTVYVYVDNKGTHLISDHKLPSGKGYRLLNRYMVDDYFGLANRPATTALTPRKSKYDKMIREISAKFGVESVLVKAMVQVESSFNPNAISPAGAQGLMQLMPQTAQHYGVNKVTDPDQNLNAGINHLSGLLNKYKQNTRLALAAYNAGEVAVKKYNGVPPFSETKAYVKKVLQLRDLYKDRPIL